MKMSTAKVKIVMCWLKNFPIIYKKALKICNKKRHAPFNAPLLCLSVFFFVIIRKAKAEICVASQRVKALIDILPRLSVSVHNRKIR